MICVVTYALYACARCLEKEGGAVSKMETVVIEAEKAVFPGGVLEPGPVYVTVEGGRISGVFSGRSSSAVTDYPTLRTPLLCPGFVDTHTHGPGKFGLHIP